MPNHSANAQWSCLPVPTKAKLNTRPASSCRIWWVSLQLQIAAELTALGQLPSPSRFAGRGASDFLLGTEYVWLPRGTEPALASGAVNTQLPRKKGTPYSVSVGFHSLKPITERYRLMQIHAPVTNPVPIRGFVRAVAAASKEDFTPLETYLQELRPQLREAAHRGNTARYCRHVEYLAMAIPECRPPGLRRLRL